MKYNFDEIIHRDNTGCLKYDIRKEIFGTSDVIPMWIADMDFKTPDFILNALKERLEHPVMGYFFHPDSYYQAIVDWMQKRHQWNISAKWICFSPGVVAGLSFLVQIFTEKKWISVTGYYISILNLCNRKAKKAKPPIL